MWMTSSELQHARSSAYKCTVPVLSIFFGCSNLNPIESFVSGLQSHKKRRRTHICHSRVHSFFWAFGNWSPWTRISRAPQCANANSAPLSQRQRWWRLKPLDLGDANHCHTPPNTQGSQATEMGFHGECASNKWLKNGHIWFTVLEI